MGQTLIGCRPTVTVWLIDVRFNSVWRTVQLSGWRDNPFRLQQREQFLFVGSVGGLLWDSVTERHTQENFCTLVDRQVLGEDGGLTKSEQKILI